MSNVEVSGVNMRVKRSSWESLREILEDKPVFTKKELKGLEFKDEETRKKAASMNREELLRVCGNLTLENFKTRKRTIDLQLISRGILEYLVEKEMDEEIVQARMDILNGYRVDLKFNKINKWLREKTGQVIIEKVGEEYKMMIFKIDAPRTKKYHQRLLYTPTPENKKILETLIEDDVESKIHHISPLEEVLEKNQVLEPKLFRISGPKWVDFQEGYIANRPEIKDIIEKLNKGRIHLVLGEAASGKSVLSRCVGFVFANTGIDTYIINADEFGTHSIESILIDIKRLEGKKALVILEDLHRYPQKASDLIQDITFRVAPNVLLLGTARPHYTEALGREERERIEEKEKDLSWCTEIKAIDIVDRVVRFYSNIEKISITENHIEEFKKLCGNDLWVLSWLLFGWDGKSINFEEVYENVREYYFKEVDKRYRDVEASQLIFMISLFYKHEIAVDRYFLTAVLKYNGNLLQKMIVGGDILEDDRGLLRLHHSSLGRLYEETARQYRIDKYGNRRVREICNDFEDDYLNLLSCYLSTNPINYTDIFHSWTLRKEEIFNEFLRSEIIINRMAETINIENKFGKIKGILTTYLMIEDNSEEKIFNKLVDRVDMDRFLLKLNRVSDLLELSYIEWPAREDERLSKLLNQIEIEKPKLNIQKTYVQLGALFSPILHIKMANKALAKRLVEKLDIEELTKDLESVEDFLTFCAYIKDIRFGSEQFAKKLVKKLDAKKVGERLQKTNVTPEQISACVVLLSDLSKKSVDPLVDEIDKKLALIEDNEKVCRCVAEILKSNEKSGMRLLHFVEKKIESIDDSKNMATHINIIAWGSSIAAKDLIGLLDIKHLKKMIKEDDEEKGGFLYAVIASYNEDVGKALKNEILTRLNDSHNTFSILCTITEFNKYVAEELSNDVDIEKMRERLDSQDPAGVERAEFINQYTDLFMESSDVAKPFDKLFLDKTFEYGRAKGIIEDKKDK